MIKEKIAEQDKNLDLLEKGLDRLHIAAKDINSEISSQKKMLDGLENDLEVSNTKIDVINNRVHKLIDKIKKDGCGIYFLIGVLFLVIMLLLFLIIFL